MSLSINSNAVKVSIVDMLTDWFCEMNQEVCVGCSLNRPESDIGYTTCPSSFDLASCPHMQYDLDEEFNLIADRLLEILPHPDEYEAW